MLRNYGTKYINQFIMWWILIRESSDETWKTDTSLNPVWIFLPVFLGGFNPCEPNPCGAVSCTVEDGVALCHGKSQTKCHFSLFSFLALKTSEFNIVWQCFGLTDFASSFSVCLCFFMWFACFILLVCRLFINQLVTYIFRQIFNWLWLYCLWISITRLTKNIFFSPCPDVFCISFLLRLVFLWFPYVHFVCVWLWGLCVCVADWLLRCLLSLYQLCSEVVQPLCHTCYHSCLHPICCFWFAVSVRRLRPAVRMLNPRQHMCSLASYGCSPPAANHRFRHKLTAQINKHRSGIYFSKPYIS